MNNLERELLKATRGFIEGVRDGMIKAMWILILIMTIVLVCGIFLPQI